MKSRNYKHGATSFKAYQKKVGSGYEVGLVVRGRPCFVGNFIHSGEANRFWSQMNSQIRNFGKRYQYPLQRSNTWYASFLSHHIYTNYYRFVDRVLPGHNRKCRTALTRDLRKWRKLQDTPAFRDRNGVSHIKAA